MKKIVIKSENGKIVKDLLWSIGTIGIFIMMIMILYSFASTKTIKKNNADGFTISSYNVNLEVSEENIVDVSENILVNWYEPYHHGIYKFTPEWLKYTGKDGKTIRRKSKVSDYIAVGDEYRVDKENGKYRIKIGSASEYVEEGEKLYQIKYKYDMGSDPFKDGDEFIFHAFGDYWGTEIQNASINVTMPKSIEDYNINFFVDKERKNNVNDYVYYDVNGSTLTAYFDNYRYNQETGKILDEALTVDIELPEGYFSKGSWNYGYKSVILIIITIGITVYCIIMWLKYGKDFKKRVMSIEYYPPDNLSSAEIGYIYGNKNRVKLSISLIISLAAKKYIKIDDTDDKKIKITSLIGREIKELKDLESMIDKRKIVIKKLKNISSELSPNANTMMKYLFKNAKLKELKANFEQFNNVRDELVNGGYIKIISDNTETRWEGHEKQKEQYEQGKEDFKRLVEEYNEKIRKLEPMNSYEKIVYDELFKESDTIILSEHKTFYKAINEVEMNLNGSYKSLIKDQKSDSKKSVGFFITILSLTLGLFSYFVTEDLDSAWSKLYILPFLCVPINLFFTIFMGRKTEYGEEIIAKIKGFKEFLNTAEKPDLERLVESNPQYFYNILPYTYVLNISKIWIKKFENIQMPKIDMGTFDYSNDRNWSRFNSDLYVPYSSGSSSSSGCSSCGSGCSSCGGGCSSCGGGGSW